MQTRIIPIGERIVKLEILKEIEQLVRSDKEIPKELINSLETATVSVSMEKLERDREDIVERNKRIMKEEKRKQQEIQEEIERLFGEKKERTIRRLFDKYNHLVEDDEVAIHFKGFYMWLYLNQKENQESGGMYAEIASYRCKSGKAERLEW